MKKGFKRTEVGVIPEEWEVVRLGDISNGVEYGSSAKSSQTGKIPVIRMGNIQNGKIAWDNLVFTDDENEISKYLLKYNDILFNRTNTVDLVGKTSIYKGERPAVFAGYLIRIKWNSNLIDPDFLNYQLNSEYSKKYSQLVLSIAVGQANINGEKLKTYPIPLPTLPEQTAIATALSDMDALIALTEKRLQKKKAIKQGLMQELLKPKEGWVMRKLGEVFEFYSTANYSKAEMSHLGEIGCIHYGLVHAITDTNYSLEKGVRYYLESDKTQYEIVKNGDVIMVDASEDLVGVNKCIEVFSVGDKKFISGLHTYLMRDINSVFVNNFRGQILNSRFVKNQMLRLAVGMKVFGVSKPQLKQILLPVPPPSTQTQIAQILSDADAEIHSLETKITKLQAQKQGMMQALLTGQIRLTE